MVKSPPTATANRETQPRVCIVAHQAFGAITGGHDGHAGGVERQTTMLATWLAQHGMAVSLLVWNEGQPAVTTVDGVQVIAMCRRDAGLPGVRFFHPRWTSLARAMRLADASLYYHNCAEYVTGQVALWCRRNDRRFVYSAASDLDCDPDLPALPHWRERVLFRYGLRHADAIILQTERQRTRLREQWQLDGEVLPMPCIGPAAGHIARPPDPSARGRVVWVGRISPEKRLDRLLEIARRLPHLDFEVAGGLDGDDDSTRHAVAEGATIANVRLLGKVPRAEMPQVYGGAVCLVCTSDYEGFPNTFLEAWSRGVPVVSTVDPDDLMTRHRFGLTGATADTLAAAIQRLNSEPGLWLELSANARQYFEAHHAYAPAMARFERIFREVLNRA